MARGEGVGSGGGCDQGGEDRKRDGIDEGGEDGDRSNGSAESEERGNDESNDNVEAVVEEAAMNGGDDGPARGEADKEA